MDAEQRFELRSAAESEVAVLAQLWFDGWQDAHAKILPAALARYRTLQSFRERLPPLLPDTRVIGPVGAPLGMCTLKEIREKTRMKSPQSPGG